MADMTELVEYLKKGQEYQETKDMAIAEALSKMGKFLEKQEMRLDEVEEERKKREEAEAMEKAAREKEMKDAAMYEAMTKSLTENVTKSVMKEFYALVKDFKGLMDLEADKVHKVSGGDKWPMNGRPASEDQELPVKLRTDTKEVQKPIQAMVNGLNDNVPPPTHDADDSVVKNEVPPVPTVPDRAKEYPVEEDENKEMPNPELAKMAAELKTMRTELLNMKKSFDTEVNKNVEKKLAKMGIREEKGLAGVRVIKEDTLGTGTPIVKSENKEADLDKIAKETSWRDIMGEYAKFKVGNMNGVPQDLINVGS